MKTNFTEKPGTPKAKMKKYTMLAIGTIKKFSNKNEKNMIGAAFTYHFGPFFHSTKTKNVMQITEIILKARIETS